MEKLVHLKRVEYLTFPKKVRFLQVTVVNKRLCKFERERKHTYYGKFMIISGTLVKLFIDNLIVVIFEGRCDREPV